MTSDAPWTVLRRFTDARIGLGRSGSALPIREVLKFSMAHAQARDAVMTRIDWTPIENALAALKLKTIRIESAAGDRDTYLRRPDLGRRLSAEARQRLAAISHRRLATGGRSPAGSRPCSDSRRGSHVHRLRRSPFGLDPGRASKRTILFQRGSLACRPTSTS